MDKNLFLFASNLLLIQRKRLVVIGGVILRILDPHPERLRIAMDAFIPPEIGRNTQPNPQHRPAIPFNENDRY